jgi:hypothetical protein
MVITKKHIARRTFLRGCGVTLALPFLEAMAPAQTPLRKTAASPRRFVGIWHPHGVAPGYFSPLQEGSNFDFSFVAKPLEPFRNRVVLISGLDVPEANPTADEPGGDHARGAVLLSGARPRRNTVSPYLGVTIDQLIAQKYGQDTILSSIQLGVEDTGNFGNCNWGYSCAYSNCISWPDATTPLPTEVNPRVAFERLFGDGATAEERLAGRKQNASILDSITREISTFKTGLGAGDRGRLDNYLQNIREIERRIQIAMSGSEGAGGRSAFRDARQQTRALPADVRPDGARVRRRHHTVCDTDAGPRSDRAQLPRKRIQWRLARIVPSWGQARKRGQLRQDEPLSRSEPRVLLREAAQYSGRRRQRARSRADLQGKQHGEFASARP